MSLCAYLKMEDSSCRLCSNDQELISVFDRRVHENLKNIVLITTGVEILETDTSSQKICKACCQFSIQAFRFRDKSIQNNQKLQENADKKRAPIPKIKIYKQYVLQNQNSHYVSNIQILASNRNIHPSIKQIFQEYPALKHPISLPLLSNLKPCVMLFKDEVDNWFKEHESKHVYGDTERRYNRKRKAKHSYSYEELITSLSSEDDTESDIATKKNKMDIDSCTTREIEIIEIDDSSDTDDKTVNIEIDKNKNIHSTSSANSSHSFTSQLPTNSSKSWPNSSSTLLSELLTSSKINYAKALNLKPVLLASAEKEQNIEPIMALSHVRKSLEVFTCKVCYMLYYSKKELTSHISKMHTKCQLCNKRFKSLQEKDSHLNHCNNKILKEIQIVVTKIEDDEELKDKYQQLIELYINRDNVDDVYEKDMESPYLDENEGILNLVLDDSDNETIIPEPSFRIETEPPENSCRKQNKNNSKTCKLNEVVNKEVKIQKSDNKEIEKSQKSLIQNPINEANQNVSNLNNISTVTSPIANNLTNTLNSTNVITPPNKNSLLNSCNSVVIAEKDQFVKTSINSNTVSSAPLNDNISVNNNFFKDIDAVLNDCQIKEIDLNNQKKRENQEDKEASNTFKNDDNHKIIQETVAELLKLTKNGSNQNTFENVICISDDEDNTVETIKKAAGSPKKVLDKTTNSKRNKNQKIFIIDNPILKKNDVNKDEYQLIKETIKQCMNTTDPPKALILDDSIPKTQVVMSLYQELYQHKIPIDIEYGEKLSVNFVKNDNKMEVKKCNDLWNGLPTTDLKNSHNVQLNSIIRHTSSLTQNECNLANITSGHTTKQAMVANSVTSISTTVANSTTSALVINGRNDITQCTKTPTTIVLAPTHNLKLVLSKNIHSAYIQETNVSDTCNTATNVQPLTSSVNYTSIEPNLIVNQNNSNRSTIVSSSGRYPTKVLNPYTNRKKYAGSKSLQNSTNSLPATSTAKGHGRVQMLSHTLSGIEKRNVADRPLVSTPILQSITPPNSNRNSAVVGRILNVYEAAPPKQFVTPTSIAPTISTSVLQTHHPTTSNVNSNAGLFLVAAPTCNSYLHLNAPNNSTSLYQVPVSQNKVIPIVRNSSTSTMTNITSSEESMPKQHCIKTNPYNVVTGTSLSSRSNQTSTTLVSSAVSTTNIKSNNVNTFPLIRIKDIKDLS